MSNRRELRSSPGCFVGGVTLLVAARGTGGLRLEGVALFLVPDAVPDFRDSPSNRPEASGVLYMEARTIVT